MPITHRATLPLCRPGEPSFMEKCGHRFDVPAEHLPPRYQDIGVEILEYHDDENVQKIPVKPIKYPDLTSVKKFDKRCSFSMFNSQHMKYAAQLIKIFDSAKDLDELISLSLYCRDQVNSQLFIYAYSVVLTHRYKSDNIDLPQLFEISPNKFFKKSTLTKVKEALAKNKRAARQTGDGPQNAVTVEVPFRNTMSVLNPEEKMNFFREDIGVNSHHWHWHLVYPDFAPIKYMKKDRRGEIFYYMHHLLVSYYDLSRLSQRIPRVVGLHNFREQINEGYFSNMTAATSSYTIPPRQSKAYMKDLNRDSNSPQTKVADLERWYERLQEAIDNGFFLDADGNVVSLNSDSGIDDFMNLLESNALSKNPQLYGDLHNSGHSVISFMHDPDMKYKEEAGLLADSTTAARDPVFYRWHKMIDDLCVKLKDRSPPYDNSNLTFRGIKINSLDLIRASDQKPTNELITFWQKSTVNLQNGLDFHANSPSLVTFTHLNYQNFIYSLKIQNQNSSAVQGTIRIFLLPVYDDKGQQFLFDGSRRLAIELDRFIARFQPGMSVINRNSADSSTTIPFNRTFPVQRDGTILMSDQSDEVQTICMCGWPQHMYLPKGSADGYPFRIFAMISDYSVDKVDQSPPNGVCNDNYVMCGLRNRKYPDSRSMGFPFDRPASDDVTVFEDFLSGRSNMTSKSITIRHFDENQALAGTNMIHIDSPN